MMPKVPYLLKHKKRFSPLNLVLKYVKKGKAIPLQAWTSPEGFWRLRFPDFKAIGI
jgi:hypothetical protein